MTLLDLLHSLTAVVLRYHAAHASTRLITGNTPDELQKSALAVSQSMLAQENLNTELKKAVNECTTAYTLRNSLLNFIVHELTFIKTMQDRKIPFNEQELVQYKQQIAQLFVDCKNLLLTNKSANYKVAHSMLGKDAVPTISVSGVKNDGYLGGKYCFSGELIDAVLAKFHISIESTHEEIKTLAENMCQAHQDSLLVPTLLASLKKEEELVKSEQAKVVTLTAKVEELTSAAETTKNELEKAVKKIAALEQLQCEAEDKAAALASKVATLTSEAASKKASVSTASRGAQTEAEFRPAFNPSSTLMATNMYPLFFPRKVHVKAANASDDHSPSSKL